MKPALVAPVAAPGLGLVVATGVVAATVSDDIDTQCASFAVDDVSSNATCAPGGDLVGTLTFDTAAGNALTAFSMDTFIPPFRPARCGGTTPIPLPISIPAATPRAAAA